MLAFTLAQLFVLACSAISFTVEPTLDVSAIQTRTLQTAWADITSIHQTASPSSTDTPAPTVTNSPEKVVTATFTPLPSETVVLAPVVVPTNTPQAKDDGSWLKVTVLDVGQGDAILIQTYDGQTALIDGGESDSGIVGKLQAQGVTRIDLMFATHPHSDHIGGLVKVLNAMPVAKVVTSGQSHTTSTYERFLDGIGAAQAEYIEAKDGDTIPFGSTGFEVLSPTPGISSDDMNQGSLVLRLSYGQITFLFMGDSESVAELAKRHDWRYFFVFS